MAAMNVRGDNARRWRVFLVTTLSLSAPAQVGARDVLWQGDDQAVVLAPREEQSATPNDHPVTLAAAEIERMLASLRFRYKDQDGSSAVFNEEQVRILGEAFATGLARATPAQDITFSVIGAHQPSPGAGVRRNRLTAGRVFFREQQLNVILGDVQSPYRKKNIYGRVEQDFHPRQYGSRAAPEDYESVLLLDGDAGIGARATRADWVEFHASGSVDEASGDLPVEPASVDPAVTGAVATGTAGSGHDTGQSSPETIAPPIEERLQTLKRLRDKGLISEEAYRQKVDEILAEL